MHYKQSWEKEQLLHFSYPFPCFLLDGRLSLFFIGYDERSVETVATEKKRKTFEYEDLRRRSKNITLTEHVTTDLQ